MSLALEEARKAYLEGEVPVGAVVVKDGRVIATGHNRREGGFLVSGHAEIAALDGAARVLKRPRLEGATLYVTLEPCLMCAGAIIQSRLFRVVYGVDDPTMGAIKSRYHVFDQPTSDGVPLLTSGIMAEEAEALLASFFASKRKEGNG